MRVVLATTGGRATLVQFQFQQLLVRRRGSCSSRLRIPTHPRWRCCSFPGGTKEMVKAISIHEVGGPEVMKWEEVQVGEPKEGEIRIRTTAIGVNFIDIYFRKGVYSAPALPFTPGRFPSNSTHQSLAAYSFVTIATVFLSAGRQNYIITVYNNNPLHCLLVRLKPFLLTIDTDFSSTWIIPASTILFYLGSVSLLLYRIIDKIDTCFNLSVPHPGMEAVGVVTAVGPGLTGRKVGDVVAYAGNPMGSYAEEQILPASVAVPVPPSVDHKVAASVMLKGMTAHMLVRRVFKVESGHTVLVHAAAGGVGSLLCQWSNALGATVIGTVSNEEKAAQATQDGCHHVIIYTKEDVVTRVKEITSGRGVNVVYDSVGKDTYEASVECLASRGFLVSFGQSSGRPDPIPLSDLASKSLFLTRPSMMHYTATRDELLESAGEVFANVANGVLRVRVNHTYPLSEAGRAHDDLESRKTSGSIVLIPDS